MRLAHVLINQRSVLIAHTGESKQNIEEMLTTKYEKFDVLLTESNVCT